MTWWERTLINRYGLPGGTDAGGAGEELGGESSRPVVSHSTMGTGDEGLRPPLATPPAVVSDSFEKLEETWRTTYVPESASARNEWMDAQADRLRALVEKTKVTVIEHWDLEKERALAAKESDLYRLRSCVIQASDWIHHNGGKEVAARLREEAGR